MKKKKCMVPNCNEIIEVEDEDEAAALSLGLSPFAICPKHMILALKWGLKKWIEAGAPE